MKSIEVLKQMYRDGEISGDELHCVISSVLIHANLAEPTKEYGSIAHATAKKIITGEV